MDKKGQKTILAVMGGVVLLGIIIFVLYYFPHLREDLSNAENTPPPSESENSQGDFFLTNLPFGI